MKITKVEPIVLSDKLDQSFYFSQWEYCERLICIVKITTDEGLVGWGEGYGPANVLREGIEFLKPLLLGKNPLETETLWQNMYRRTLDYARRGILMASVSALDIALWDLKGKILGQPVHVLLGGKKRDKIRPYATGMYFSQVENLPQVLADEALHYKENNFQYMKMKVGLGIKDDLANIEAVRNAIGFDINLMVDSNHAYGYNEAYELAREMEAYKIGWFEEPLSPEDYNGYARLRTNTSIPIAGGECEYLRFGFKTLFENGCVDIAQPDICAAGGISEVKKIIDMAYTFGVDVVPHSWGTGIALNAALQVLTNMDMVPGRMKEPEALVELDFTENKLREELIFPNITLTEGYLLASEKPGLGLDVNEAIIQKYKI
jgi:D-galactarolactone cycloisomerase